MTQAILQLPEVDPVQIMALPNWPPTAWCLVSPLVLQQTWRSSPESGLLSSQVWLGATKDRFVVLAEMEDSDIGTAALRHNDPLWKLGDVFEVFVRHIERPDYFEFHTAPNGVTLDLHYPMLYASRAGGVAQYMMTEPCFTATVGCEPKLNRWRAVIEIPVGGLVPREYLSTPSVWQFSFCRYDCGPGRPAVVASNSPHAVADFHRAEDWPLFTAPAFAVC
jgi:hypothetical protein